MLVRRGRRSGLFTIVAVHSTVRGPSLGGCRMWEYDDSRAALRDALRLSRAMTHKAAVLNAGGLINITEELGTYDAATARRRVRGIGDTLRQIFADAESMNATPLTAAMELARRRLVVA